MKSKKLYLPQAFTLKLKNLYIKVEWKINTSVQIANCLRYFQPNVAQFVIMWLFKKKKVSPFLFFKAPESFLQQIELIEEHL